MDSVLPSWECEGLGGSTTESECQCHHYKMVCTMCLFLCHHQSRFLYHFRDRVGGLDYYSGPWFYSINLGSFLFKWVRAALHKHLTQDFMLLFGSHDWVTFVAETLGVRRWSSKGCRSPLGSNVQWCAWGSQRDAFVSSAAKLLLSERPFFKCGTGMCILSHGEAPSSIPTLCWFEQKRKRNVGIRSRFCQMKASPEHSQ